MTTLDVTPQDIIDFYVNDVGPAKWYNATEELDETIRTRFGHVWEIARSGGLKSWLTNAKGTLALIIVLDQFPRNMFRHDERAFATDAMARSVAKRAFFRRDDQTVTGPERILFYMPLMHAENNADQDASVRAFLTRTDSENALLHARGHREVIRKFGRFPTRNAMMGRKSSPAELAYLEAGGYRSIIDSLSPSA